jgi:hypothetical protein
MIPLRTWATPLTIGTFLLMATTGVLMFFDWNLGLTTVVHQWFSWLFLAAAAGHIAVNVRPFKNHLRSRRGKASIATFMFVLAASFFSWGLISGPRLLKPVEQALVDAPLETLAGLTRTTPDALVRRLKARGIVATSLQSVHELSRESGVGKHRLLAIVFLPE